QSTATGPVQAVNTKKATPGGVADAVLLSLFVWLDVQRMWAWSFDLRNFGDDGAIYRGAAAAWLSGGNPWTVTSATGAYFGAPPPTLLLAAPFVAVDELVTRILWIAIAGAAGAWSVRRLRLPLWWILFPPPWI